MPRAARRATSSGASRLCTTTSGPRRAGAAGVRTTNPAPPPPIGSAHQTLDLLADDVVADPVEQAQRAERGVGARHRRRAALESVSPVGRPVERVDPERERIDAPEPAGDRRLEALDQVAAHVEKRHAGRREQVFQAAGHHEIDAERVHVDRPRAGPLVVVEQHVRAARVAEPVTAAMSVLCPFLKQTCVVGTISVRSSTTAS